MEQVINIDLPKEEFDTLFSWVFINVEWLTINNNLYYWYCLFNEILTSMCKQDIVYTLFFPYKKNISLAASLDGLTLVITFWRVLFSSTKFRLYSFWRCINVQLDTHSSFLEKKTSAIWIHHSHKNDICCFYSIGPWRWLGDYTDNTWKGNMIFIEFLRFSCEFVTIYRGNQDSLYLTLVLYINLNLGPNSNYSKKSVFGYPFLFFN